LKSSWSGIAPAEYKDRCKLIEDVIGVRKTEACLLFAEVIIVSDSNYMIPKTLDECLVLLGQNKGEMKVLAGGTEILPRMRIGKEQVGAILDISGLGLNYIHEDEEKIAIGAMTDISSINEYFACAHQPVRILSEAARQIGSWQTRNLATVGGNICAGNSCADLAVALLVLDAKLKIVCKEHNRTVPIDRFFLSPREVNLNKNEILTEISINKTSGYGYGSCFIKNGVRKGHCIAIMSVAVAMKIGAGMEAENVKTSVGVLAPTPIRLYKTEEFLTGNKLSDAVIEKAQEIMLAEISPRTSLRSTMEYRLDIAPVLLKRAILASAGQ